MLDFLEKLQEKSDDGKKAIAVFVSLGLTSLIFVFWFTSSFVDFGEGVVVVTKEDIEIVKETKTVSLSPLDSIKETTAQVGEAFSDLRSIFDGLNSLQYERSE